MGKHNAIDIEESKTEFWAVSNVETTNGIQPIVVALHPVVADRMIALLTAISDAASGYPIDAATSYLNNILDVYHDFITCPSEIASANEESVRYFD